MDFFTKPLRKRNMDVPALQILDERGIFQRETTKNISTLHRLSKPMRRLRRR
jgi:hypothetical protein